MEDWIADLLESTGYLGVALLMLLENVFPPIPSEVVMPYAGYVAATGELGIVGTIAAGTAGSVLGALPWYALGRWYSLDRLKDLARRHGKWLTVRPDELDAAMAWFERHGHTAVLLGRMVPGVRTLISVPAGLCAMPLPTFLLYTTLGTTAWTSLLALAGYFLGQRWSQVGDYIGPVSNGILALALVWYVMRVVRAHLRERREGRGT